MKSPTHRSPAHAKGGGNRKKVSQARVKAARQTKSHAMMKKHDTARKGTRNLSWLMSAGK